MSLKSKIQFSAKPAAGRPRAGFAFFEKKTLKIFFRENENQRLYNTLEQTHICFRYVIAMEKLWTRYKRPCGGHTLAIMTLKDAIGRS